MKPLTFLLPLAVACGSPVITNPTVEDNVDEKDSSSVEETEGTESEDTTDETDTPYDNGTDDSTDNGSSDNGPTGGSDYVLESTTWFVSQATMIEDTCAWDAPLRDFFGIGSDALLPSDFTVVGNDGSFEIEANSYGAAGPITCTFVDSEFECETQSVTPLDFDLGTYGWTYAIDFSGAAYSERSLMGIAEVRFPTVSDWLIPIFQSMGMDYTQCVQTFELALSVD